MTDMPTVCLKCNSAIDEKSRFCSCCGADIALQKKIHSKKIKVSLRWILFSIISILIFEFIFATVAGKLFILITGSETIEFETSLLVSSIGSLTGIYFGAMYSAYMSPGLSIKEPVIGALIEIFMSQLILLVLAGEFSYLFIIRLLIITTIAFAGAKSGDWLQMRKLKH